MASGSISPTRTVLLWTNPSPYATFAGQTVGIGALASYSAVLITFKIASSGTYFVDAVVPVDSTTHYPTFVNMVSSGACSAVRRAVTASGTGVVFGTGQYKVLPSDARTDDNDTCVPVSIYAIA